MAHQNRTVRKLNIVSNFWGQGEEGIFSDINTTTNNQNNKQKLTIRITILNNGKGYWSSSCDKNRIKEKRNERNERKSKKINKNKKNRKEKKIDPALVRRGSGMLSWTRILIGYSWYLDLQTGTEGRLQGLVARIGNGKRFWQDQKDDQLTWRTVNWGGKKIGGHKERRYSSRMLQGGWTERTLDWYSGTCSGHELYKVFGSLKRVDDRGSKSAKRQVKFRGGASKSKNAQAALFIFLFNYGLSVSGLW